LSQTPDPAMVPRPPDRGNPWSIGFYSGETPFSIGPASGVENPVITAGIVTDLPAEFVADPFLVREGGRWFLFFEIMPANAKEGVIGLAESEDGLAWSYRGVVLQEAFHLSYPHVFRWGRDYYMTPETLGAHQIRLYRAASFPDRWEHIADLVPGRHADPTVFEADGGWWMFSCTPPGEHMTLRLYYADTPMGPWHEHPRSPIVSNDRRIARPAGRVVAWSGGLVRFTQDCEAYYGVQVRAFLITRLTRSEYREEPLQPNPVVGPAGGHGWNRRGMHHVDAIPLPSGGWFAAVDAR
jgi:hypothetical protein